MRAFRTSASEPRALIGPVLGARIGAVVDWIAQSHRWAARLPCVPAKQSPASWNNSYGVLFHQIRSMTLAVVRWLHQRCEGQCEQRTVQGQYPLRFAQELRGRATKKLREYRFCQGGHLGRSFPYGSLERLNSIGNPCASGYTVK